MQSLDECFRSARLICRGRLNRNDLLSSVKRHRHGVAFGNGPALRTRFAEPHCSHRARKNNAADEKVNSYIVLNYIATHV